LERVQTAVRTPFLTASGHGYDFMASRDKRSHIPNKQIFSQAVNCRRPPTTGPSGLAKIKHNLNKFLRKLFTRTPRRLINFATCTKFNPAFNRVRGFLCRRADTLHQNGRAHITSRVNTGRLKFSIVNFNCTSIC